jgi:hypothetical protein
MPYILKIAALAPGDIVLVRTTGVGKLIAVGTRGRFSHAMIFAGGKRFIEAMPDAGVINMAVDRVIAKDRENLAVMRYVGSRPDDARSIAAKAADIASNLVSSGFTRTGALLSVFAGPLPAEGQFFCSYLIAEAFSQAQAELSDKYSHLVTPNDIRRSSKLRDISDVALVHIEQKDLIASAKFLDDSPGIRPISKESLKLRKLVEMTNNDLQTYPPPKELRDKWIIELQSKGSSESILGVDFAFESVTNFYQLQYFLIFAQGTSWGIEFSERIARFVEDVHFDELRTFFRDDVLRYCAEIQKRLDEFLEGKPTKYQIALENSDFSREIEFIRSDVAELRKDRDFSVRCHQAFKMRVFSQLSMFWNDRVVAGEERVAQLRAMRDRLDDKP